MNKLIGTGDACASAEAAAGSQASGFAKIVAKAVVEASNTISEARAEGAVDVVIDVIAEVGRAKFVYAIGQSLRFDHVYSERSVLHSVVLRCSQGLSVKHAWRERDLPRSRKAPLLKPLSNLLHPLP